MLWIVLDAPPAWAWFVILGVFAVLSVIVFRFSFGAYHRRYFFNKALSLAFWRTVAWFVLNAGSFCLVFWVISLAFPAIGWWAYLAGCFMWWLLSQSLVAAGMRIVEQLLENW